MALTKLKKKKLYILGTENKTKNLINIITLNQIISNPEIFWKISILYSLAQTRIDRSLQ